MAGYSGKPLLAKLGLKAGMSAQLHGAVYKAPAGLKKEGPPFDFIHLFAKSRAELEKRFPALAKALLSTGMLWISWPKKASGVETDLDETVVRQTGLKSGLVDVKVCAVDDVWSGLKFVVRLKDR